MNIWIWDKRSIGQTEMLIRYVVKKYKMVYDLLCQKSMKDRILVKKEQLIIVILFWKFKVKFVIPCKMFEQCREVL